MFWSYFFFLLWFVYLIVSSILLFTKGFLLTKESLNFNSSCSRYSDNFCSSLDVSLISNNENNIGFNPSCSADDKLENIIRNFNTTPQICLPVRARVIVIIIDALRYDFTLMDTKNENKLLFQNNMPIIQKMLQDAPERTRLFKFIADPPTTTMQRLKGLTTGSLPTFIDASSNFASTEIKEDNLIDQLLRYNQNIVFMGDDTWESLYPNRFKRSYPFPSFNVRDLDTVDKGVSENLFPELSKKDWSLLIGHYLGVDHAGHRYGSNHPEMQRKLREMNTVIEKVIENMADDMILYVFGDHGMTNTGDHGGETENEVNSALFIYSKVPLSIPQNTTATKQVNIVPTLASVLGVPIPFSNLGSILPEALPILNHPTVAEWKFSLHATWSNVEQVVKYLRQYSSNSDIFENDKLNQIYTKFEALKANMHEVRNDKSFEQFHHMSTEFIVDVRMMCEKAWIQFDAFSISRGLLLLILSIIFVFILTDGVPANYLKELFLSRFLICSYVSLIFAILFTLALYYYEVITNLMSSIFFATGVVSQFMLAMLIAENWDTISLNWYSKSERKKFGSGAYRLVLAFNLLCFFSNSYIEKESDCLLFLLSTVSLVGVFVFCRNILRDKHSSKWIKYKFILFSIGMSILLRLSINFKKCREEDVTCISENSFNNKETTKFVWFIALSSLAIFVKITKTWLKNCGSLNDLSVSATLSKYAPVVMVVCTGVYWILHRLPFDDKTHSIPTWRADHMVWVVYITSIIGVACIVIQPLLLYILPRKSDLGLPTDVNVIPQIFNKIKGLIEEKEKSKNEMPIIYGLGTVFSSTFIVIGVNLTILFALLLGEAEAPSAVIMFLTAMYMLVLISVLRIENAANIDDLFEISNTSILVWVILSHYFFYATGHQPVWSNIDWNAAFVGTSGVLSNNYVQGLLVILNTFCSYIIMGFLLPLFVVVPFTLFIMTPSVLNKNREVYKEIMNQGELVLFENSEKVFTVVFVCSCKYFACHGIRVFASMLAATVHCRHLMVWNVFAPKFVFEATGMLVTLISVIFGYLVLLRINYKLTKFIKKLNSR
ncbi:hypothetical protein WA026_013342 [Henosepilachna vigintioctopunctata]|uniref:GPI ethanolamine phosphate transferase 3 n=1 Tax=Henosepilachna vigintioctopunctata TaxID=420089 RepID=A0AAW1VCU5_9CUCU